MKKEMVKELNDESKEMIKVLDDESKEESLAEKVIDLCLWYQIEDSHNMIKIFESEIKILEMQKEMILSNCTFKFQRKKVEKELEEIDKKICNTVKKLEDETQNLIELTQLMKEDFDGEIKEQ